MGKASEKIGVRGGEWSSKLANAKAARIADQNEAFGLIFVQAIMSMPLYRPEKKLHFGASESLWIAMNYFMPMWNRYLGNPPV